MGIYNQRLNTLLKHNRFADLMPVIEYLEDEKVFLLEGPAIGAMVVCIPTSGCNDDIRNSLNNLYKIDYAPGTMIQVSLVSTPDIKNSLYGYKAIRTGRMLNEDSDQSEIIADSIHDFFDKGSQQQLNQSGFRYTNKELWFTVKTPIKEALPSEKELEKFQINLRSMLSMLSVFAPMEANEFDYKRRMSVLLNMYDQDGWAIKPQHKDKEQRDIPLREMLLAPGKKVEVEADGIRIKNAKNEDVQFIKTLSITEMPEDMIYGQMLNLLGDWEQGHTGLYEPFMLTLNIHYPDQIKAKSDFSNKRTFIMNQARGSLLNYLDKLRYQKRDFDAINRELDQEGSKLIKYSLQVVTFNKNREKANEFSERMRGYYSRLNIQLIEDNFFALPFFLGCMPFGLDQVLIDNSSRFNTATSKALVFLTPHMASWGGNTAYPVMMLGSRSGQLVGLDFYSSPTNYNAFVAATSGAGKSFFVGYYTNLLLGSGMVKLQNPDMIREAIAKDKRAGKKFAGELPDDGARVFIIDVGRSYEGLAAQYTTSKFLVFGSSFKYSMNPFPSITALDGKEGQANMLRAIIKTMASPTGNITDFQNAELYTILSEVWKEKGQKATITDVSNKCLSHEEHDMRRIGQQLKPFCDDGVYGDFFSNRYPPANFDSRLVVCELEELKSDPHLQVVVLMSVMLQIQHSMYLSGTKRKQALIIDEGWEYLKSDPGKANMLAFFAEFLETAWRRLRKTNGSGVLVTQSVMDGYASPTGRAIINNSAWMLLMKQNAEAVDNLEKESMYSGTKSDFSLIRSLRTVKAQPGLSDEAFSEVFVRYEGHKQVCRLYTDRFLQLVLTTTPSEKEKRAEYMAKGLDLKEATQAMLNDELRITFKPESETPISADKKLSVVMALMNMDDTEAEDYCRARGLTVQQAKRWSAEAARLFSSIN